MGGRKIKGLMMGREGGEGSGVVLGLWWPSESSDEPGSQNNAVEENAK